MSAIPLSRASSGLAGAYARPSTSIVPASGLIRPASTFINVLLPAPFSPISACTSPFCKRRFTPSSATVGPKRLLIFERERTVIDLRENTNRNAVAPSSPTLPLRLRWVNGRTNNSKPQRGCAAFSSRYVPYSARGRNPVGVGNSTINRSQGSRNGNPWAEGHNRFAVYQTQRPKLKEHRFHAAPFGNS